MPTTTTRKALQRLAQLIKPAGAIKTAALGDSESSFEQAMASLAQATLSDKMPKLMPYSMGFQLMKKNDEGTRAVGIQAFKIAEQWLFVPIFFINGSLKGTELMYIKNQDLFVPAQDSWIDYLLGRQPLALGEGVDRNLSRLGVQGPHLYQLSRPPLKYASASEPWRRDVFHTFARHAVQPVSFPRLDLRDFLKTASLRGYQALLKLCAAYPLLTSAVDRHYPELLTKQGFQQWAAGDTPREHLRRVKIDSQIEHGEDAWNTTGRYARKAKPEADKRKSLLDLMAGEGERAGTTADPAAIKVSRHHPKVAAAEMDRPGGTDIRDLNADEKKTLLRKRYIVKDDRDDSETALAYDAATPLKLFNPDQSNLYEILIRPDTFKRCLVLKFPYSYSDRHDFCTVVDLADKRWVNLHPSRVWALSEAGRESWQEFYDKLPDDKLTVGSQAIILTSTGQATTPFTVSKIWGDPSAEDGSCSLDVNYSNYAEYGRDRAEYKPFPRSQRFSEESYPAYMRKIRLTGKPSATITRHLEGELWIPRDHKVITLKKPQEYDRDGELYEREDGPHTEPQPLDPGSIADVQMLIQNNTYPLKISTRGEEVSLDDAQRQKEASAIVELVLKHNLREKAAVQMIRQARKTGSALFRIKKAAPMANLVDSAPNAPPIWDPGPTNDPVMGSRYPAQLAAEWEEPVTDIQGRYQGSGHLSPLIEPDQMTLNHVMNAVQSGEKDVFDTAMLGSLLRVMNDDNLIDRHLGNILKGMSALGRILFSFYWHQDMFADRYGKSDMPEIEDGLRNAFDACGQIALQLKAKKIHSQLDVGITPDMQDSTPEF